MYVHDRERFYRLSVPRSQKAAAQEMPTHHGYTRVGTDETVVVSPADQVTLDQMLLQRVIAKRTRDFPTADQLRKAWGTARRTASSSQTTSTTASL